MDFIIRKVSESLKSRRDRVVLHTLCRESYATRPKITNLDTVEIKSHEHARSFRSWLIHHGKDVKTLDLVFNANEATLLGVLCTLDKLESLTFSTSSTIDPFFINSMTSLHTLSLECMSLASPSWSRIPPSLHTFELLCKSSLRLAPEFGDHFPNLKTLSIASRSALNATCYPPSVTSLTLDGNMTCLEPIEALATLTELQRLKISYGRLAFAPDELELLTKLTHLDLSHNSMQSYDNVGYHYDDVLESISHLPRLKYLDLSHNEMDNATFEELRGSSLSTLEYLDISHNSKKADVLPTDGCLYLNTLKFLRTSFIPSNDFFQKARQLEEFTYCCGNSLGMDTTLSFVSMSIRPKKIKLETSSIPSHHIQPLLQLMAQSYHQVHV